ncbi:hypothetical protein LDENG_00041510 [Lucifuga dentata]|nr:hypothetical protein LDENG_00041510 [Lucifuga dentata]
MMDSRSRRLPFSLSGPRSSYVSSSSVSSSSLSSSRLHSRERVLNSDCFPRASSALKADLEQTPRHLSSSRNYASSDSCSTSWKLPSLRTSTTSYDRPWAESSLNSRSKLSFNDSAGRLGIHSGLSNTSDDGDSKRAKLSYSNRVYSRTATPSLTASTYSSGGEKQSDSSWCSSNLLSRSSASPSKPLLSRRPTEMTNEHSLSGLGEKRVKIPGLASSLSQSDRMTSTYAQGARPKDTVFSSSSSTRESSLSRHLSSSASHWTTPLVHDLSSRTTSRFLAGSSSPRSSQETRNRDSTTDIASSYSSHTSWYTSRPARQEATLPPRPAPEGAEPESRHLRRRILSRLFLRRSSQDSSGTRSFDSSDDSPSMSGESVDGEEGARTSSVEPDVRGSEASRTAAAFGHHTLDLPPIQENQNDSYQARMTPWREPGVSSSSNTNSGGGGSSSWLSSSLRSRCPPFFSRHRRHRQEEAAVGAEFSVPEEQSPYLEGRILSRDSLDSVENLPDSQRSMPSYRRDPENLRKFKERRWRRDENTSSDLDQNCSHPQHLLRRWDNQERKASQEDEEEEEEGAAGIEFSLLEEQMPYLEVSYLSSDSDVMESVQNGQRNKPSYSRDPEKLRKIKESLLLEDSDEEEGDLCRICQMGEESASNPLIEPCRCTGSLRYVHQECIKKWLCSKISSGTNLEAITTCELCKEKLHLNIDNFDIRELYRTHVQSEYDEFISSGLCLVVLLHFCEQRFSDVLGAANEAGLFNLARTLHEHMDSLEIPRGEGDEDGDEVQDNRPSIDFSDLDDDLEEEF